MHYICYHTVFLVSKKQSDVADMDLSGSIIIIKVTIGLGEENASGFGGYSLQLLTIVRYTLYNIYT